MEQEMEAKNDKNLWWSILDENRREVQRKSENTKSLLVLGNAYVGKSSLIAHLQGRGGQKPKFGVGLQYEHIDFQDEYHDELRRLSVWSLDNEIPFTQLLKHALNEKNFKDTMVMLVLSLEEPWKWPQQMNYWVDLLKEYVRGLGLSLKEREAAQQLLLYKWRSYLEQESSGNRKRRWSLTQFLNEHGSTKDDAIPIEEGVFELNLGLDIVVVVTKVDQFALLERKFDMNEIHFDFMQQWLRRYCLKIGAALIYTSAWNDKNCNVLQKYLAERIYNQTNDSEPEVIERDLIFVPAGWDSLNKIAILGEQLTMLENDCAFGTVIAEPKIKKEAFKKEPLIDRIDEQAFFAQQLEINSDLGKPPQIPVQLNIPTEPMKRGNIKKHALPDNKCGSSLEQFFKNLLKGKTSTKLSHNKDEGDNVNVTASPTNTSKISEMFDKLTKKKPNKNNNNDKSDEAPKD